MAEEKNKTLQKARVEMNYLTGDDEVRRLAELREKWEMDRISEINYAKREGKEEGKQEGKQEGKRLTQIEIAKNMLKENISLDIIQKVTELSKNELEKIKIESN